MSREYQSLPGIPGLRVDHRPRIDFYVQKGLIPKAPTTDQLVRAFRKFATSAGFLLQIKYYLHHPLMIFPSAAKREYLEIPLEQIEKTGYEPVHIVAKRKRVERERLAEPRLDRALKWLFMFSPARLATQALFNPYALMATSGLAIPSRFLIAHIVQTPHPPPGVWDLQIIHPDPGALDELDRRLDRAIRADTLSGRLDRALGTRPGHLEYYKEMADRVRRFDYPPMPEGLNPLPNDLVSFLKFAAEF